MAPVLQPDTDASIALGDQQDPILMIRQVAFAFTLTLVLAVLLLSLDMQLFERALEVLGEGDFVGRLLARLLPADGRAAGGRDQEVALGGTGRRRWKGDSKIALSSSESTS